ncbi:MAG: sugar ABC transporter permease [Clostridiales Family XIII bacterium]|nr:sugar ABC transporter permease [Clostridiales Family XIII bacterium]
MLVFWILPILFTFAISFTKWDGFNAMQFIGIENYKHLFLEDGRFFKSLFNTVVIMGLSIPVTLVLALIFAYILSGKALYAKRFLQLGVFLPYIMTPVAVGIIFALLFDQHYGFVNRILMYLHIIQSPLPWLGNEWLARITLAIALIWMYCGYQMILLMSGMSMISEDVYDAARIDGANTRQVFFRITLPLLKGVLVFVVITSLIGGFQLFDEPLLLFNSSLSGKFPIGGPDNAALTMSLFFYNESYTNFNFGYGAAISYMMFVVIALISFVSMKIMDRGDRL